MKKSFTDMNVLWLEKAPMCSCSRDKILYICLKEDCSFRDQKHYCQACLVEGKHNHFPLVQLSTQIAIMDGQWSELQERVNEIKVQCERRIHFLMPLITYIEQPQEEQQSSAASIIGNKLQMSIAKDLEKMESILVSLDEQRR